VTDKPLDQDEMRLLSVYNAEVARGIIHRPTWQIRMADLQRRFDTAGYARDLRWPADW